MFGAVLVAVILVKSTIFVVIVLLPAGMAWVGMLATVNSLLQLFLPSWVRARGLSVYQMVLFGAQGLGAALWGVVADSFGLIPAFLVAAGLTLGSAASIRIWPLVDTSGMDRRNLARSDPVLEVATRPDSGPIVVRTTYVIPPDRDADFARVMALVRQARLRTGATQWGLFRNGERHDEFEEIFMVASWDEHLRQHSERMIASDLASIEEAKALSETTPHTWQLLPADLDQKERR